MSYHSELDRENRELADENRDLRVRLEHYGEDQADIFEHKGVIYFNVSQVEIPADVLVSVVFGINRSAEHKVIQAVKAALTEGQQERLEQMTNLDFKDQSAVLAELPLVEQPYGAVIIHKLTSLMEQAAKQ